VGGMFIINAKVSITKLLQTSLGSGIDRIVQQGDGKRGHQDESNSQLCLKAFHLLVDC